MQWNGAQRRTWYFSGNGGEEKGDFLTRTSAVSSSGLRLTSKSLEVYLTGKLPSPQGLVYKTVLKREFCFRIAYIPVVRYRQGKFWKCVRSWCWNLEKKISFKPKIKQDILRTNYMKLFFAKYAESDLSLDRINFRWRHLWLFHVNCHLF